MAPLPFFPRKRALGTTQNHVRARGFAHQAVRIAWDKFRINTASVRCPTWWDDGAPDWRPIVK